MSVNGISNSQSTAYSPVSSKTTKAADKTKSESASSKDAGVVYEPSKATESAGSKVKDYSSIAKKMKGELNTKNQQLQNLVNQLLSKQANKYTRLSQLFEDVKNGKISVDPSTVAQAQKDIADDGYWGIEQTSDRLVSMAQALSGGDASKADKMIAAIKKGFDQAAKAWGGKLPDICQKTIDAATKKMEDWRDGLSTPKTEE
ncbi:MAG: hypothetical protein HFG37_05440 [Eubacterium sp.]|nr:hypothetical protein [Eubacterium sp.]